MMEKDVIQRQVYKVLQSSTVRSHVHRISLFGSHLHGTAKQDSDVDLLIEFNQPVSLLTLVHMERDLSKALGQNVDLCTPKSLSKYFRSDVEQEAELLFESVV